jgi:hypothetical protein
VCVCGGGGYKCPTNVVRNKLVRDIGTRGANQVRGGGPIWCIVGVEDAAGCVVSM